MKKRHLEILGYHVIQVWNTYIIQPLKTPESLVLHVSSFKVKVIDLPFF